MELAAHFRCSCFYYKMMISWAKDGKSDAGLPAIHKQVRQPEEGEMEKREHFAGIKKAWKQLSLQNQIFLSIFLITLLGVGFLMNIVYKTSVDAIEQNYRTSYQSTLKNSSRVMDMNLKNIVDVGRNFLNEEALQKVLENGDEYAGLKFSSVDRTILRNVANEMASQQVWVNYIVFTDLYGHVYQLNNINLGTYDFYNYYEDADILKEDWVKKAEEARGREVFFGDSILETGSGSGFSYAKYMINPSTGKGMGYMVVGLSKKLLGQSFVMGNERFDSSNFMVVDEDGNLVYFVGNNKRENEIVRAFSDRDKKSIYLFSSVENSTTGWKVVNVVEKNELSEESKNIRLVSFLVAGCILVLGFLFAKIISKTITRPLKQLENTIAQVGEGERHITEEFDYSEVGRIGQKFKEMVNTNLELSEHLMAVKLNEREAELLLLQSQINPHFLYNTLDSLYFVAIMHGDDQMAEMVEALSDNFKLALNNGSKYITVADSVKWIQGYMKLQNMRYNNRFELFVDISREILQRETITFIFQPFIENAMYHGLEPKIGKGRIALCGWQEQNNMIFTIEDDGVGIEDMSRLEKGYGVRNVIERIKLNYGEKYGVTFESSPGKGTKVTIVVPVR